MKKAKKHRWAILRNAVLLILFCLYALSLTDFRENVAKVAKTVSYSTYSGICEDVFELPFGLLPIRLRGRDVLYLKMDNGSTYIVDEFMISEDVGGPSDSTVYRIQQELKGQRITINYCDPWIFWPWHSYLVGVKTDNVKYIDEATVYEYWHASGKGFRFFLWFGIGCCLFALAVQYFPIPQVSAFVRRKKKERKKTLRKKRKLEKQVQQDKNHNS